MNKPTRFSLPRSVKVPSFQTAWTDGDPFVDVKAVLRALRRHIWLGVVTFATVFTSVAVYTFQQTPIYASTARLVIDQRNNQPAIDFGSAFTGLPADTAVVDTELEVIKSKTLLSKVVPKLDLTSYPEFNFALQEPTAIGSLKTALGDAAGMILGGNDEDEGPMTEAQLKAAAEGYAVFKLQQAITVERLGPTYVIDITARSETPELAAQIANTVADQYLVEQLEAKLESTRRANEWLSERISGLREEVNAKESAVEIFRNESGLLTAQGSTLTEQQIADIQAQRSQQLAELREAEARLNNVRSRLDAGGGAEAIAEVLNSAVIGDLRSQLADVQRRRADLLTRYGPRHPDVQRVNSEVADLNEQIDQEIGRIVSNLESQVSIARQRLNSFEQSLQEARGRLASNNRAQVRLRELEREAEASRVLYEDFLERFKQTSEEDDLARPDARVLSDAGVPTVPASPNTSVNLILGFLMSGVFAGGFILIAELRENHFSSTDEIERVLGVPSLGTIPLVPGLRSFGRANKSPADYAIENPLSAFSESMRNLRASIVFSDLDNPARTVAICSSLPDEGKTMTSYALGRTSAMSGSRTLVIDGDFRRRQLTEAAGLEPEQGLIEHLFGEVSLEEVMVRDEATGLDILPLSNSRNTPRDVFGSRAFDALLQQLEELYDLIVIDTGPLLLMAESRVIVSKVDQVIVVAKWRGTPRTAVSQSLGLLNRFHANVSGVVLNFVDFRKRRLLDQSGASYKAYSKYYSEGRG